MPETYRRRHTHPPECFRAFCDRSLVRSKAQAARAAPAAAPPPRRTVRWRWRRGQRNRPPRRSAHSAPRQRRPTQHRRGWPISGGRSSSLGPAWLDRREAPSCIRFRGCRPPTQRYHAVRPPIARPVASAGPDRIPASAWPRGKPWRAYPTLFRRQERAVSECGVRRSQAL